MVSRPDNYEKLFCQGIHFTETGVLFVLQLWQVAIQSQLYWGDFAQLNNRIVFKFLDCVILIFGILSDVFGLVLYLVFQDYVVSFYAEENQSAGSMLSHLRQAGR